MKRIGEAEEVVAEHVIKRVPPAPGDPVADQGFEPPPVIVIWPGGQEQTGVLHARHQVPGNWLYLIGVTLWNANERGEIERVEYRTWVEAPLHVRPVDGVSYDVVPTKVLPPPLPVEPTGRPTGWVLQRLAGRGPVRGVVHAPDCEEAPAGAPVLALPQALDAAEHPGTRLCALCGAAQELEPLLNGFDHIQDG
ncbi:DUF6233 domain-containing protein [Streptomyces violascens]|uniref:DUF6233 domain-containing protein n=1 Tax=Streptomyces violascens TaxID=67381 RepID=UPI0037B628EB